MRVSQQVENILRASVLARNSDKELAIIYMQKSGMNLTPEQIAIFKKMPSLETVRRSRQYIQEKGKYLPTKAIEERRYQLYKEMKYRGDLPPDTIMTSDKTYTVLPFGV